MSAFSETLRRLRFERHMTQEEFADLLGTTKQNISRYESGAVSPKISTAKAIADKLGISLSELSGDTSAQETKQKLHDIGQQLTEPFRSKEFTTLSEGLEELEKHHRDLFQALYNFLTTTYPDTFTERMNDDDPES